MCEILFDITQIVPAMIRNGRGEAEDSRELFGTCLTLARQFETEQLKIEGNCMPAIEGFAAGRRTEHYGRAS
jgi:hypothetical protein